MKVKSLSLVQLFATCQAPPPMGFSRQEYWNGLLFLSPGDLPNPGIEPWSPTLQTVSLPSEPPGKPRCCCCHFSPVRPSVTPWTAAFQVPPSMGFSRQEYWSGLPCLSPGDLPEPGIEPGSPTLQADSLLSSLPGKALTLIISSVQSLSHVRLFATHESQHTRPPCPSPTPKVHLDSRPSSQ